MQIQGILLSNEAPPFDNVASDQEHVMFTGLYWTPFARERLEPDFAAVDDEDRASWKALPTEAGTTEMMEVFHPSKDLVE